MIGKHESDNITGEEKEEAQEVLKEVQAKFEESTVESLLRGLEMAGSIDNTILRSRAEGQVLSRLLPMLENEDDPKSKELAKELEAEYRAQYVEGQDAQKEAA